MTRKPTLTPAEEAQQEKLLTELRNFRDQLPMLFTPGADYSRAAATHWNDALHCAQKGDVDAARHFYNLLLETVEEMA